MQIPLNRGVQICVILFTYCYICSWLISLQRYKRSFQENQVTILCVYDCLSLIFRIEHPWTLKTADKIFKPTQSKCSVQLFWTVWWFVILATTNWLKLRLSDWQGVWGGGGRWVLHLLPPPPPTHPRCRSLIRPHHQLHKTNTYESQQERIHKSGCSSIQIVLLLLFQEPFVAFLP